AQGFAQGPPAGRRHRAREQGFSGQRRGEADDRTAIVSRFRSSHHYAARAVANFGIKGTLAIYDFSAGFGFEVPTRTRGHNDRNFKSTPLVRETARPRASGECVPCNDDPDWSR